jgi:hypothetical protein
MKKIFPSIELLSTIIAVLSIACADNSGSTIVDALTHVDTLEREVEADGIVFYTAPDQPPFLVPNHNDSSIDVPLHLKETGAFFLYVAPASTEFVSGYFSIEMRLFDATGTRQIGSAGLTDGVQLDGLWSYDERDFVLLGGCYNQHYDELEPGGPFILRLDATDAARTTAHAEVLIRPSCAIATGTALPELPRPIGEMCAEECPGSP